MRDEKVERYLDSVKAEYRFLRNLLLSTIDVKASLRHQNRFTPLDEGFIERYRTSMLRGDEFPAITVRKVGSVYHTLDGIHRVHAAFAAGIQTLDAYVIESDDANLLELVSRSLNLLGSHEISRAEALANARLFVERYGHTLKAASFEWRVGESALGNYLIECRSKERAVGLGCATTIQKIASSSAMQALGAISFDLPFIAALELVADAQLPTSIVDSLSRDIRQQNSEQAMLDLIAARRDEYKHRIQGRLKGSPAKKAPFSRADNMMAAMSRLLNPIEQGDLLKAGITTPDLLAQFESRFDELNKKMWRAIAYAKVQFNHSDSRIVV